MPNSTARFSSAHPSHRRRRCRHHDDYHRLHCTPVGRPPSPPLYPLGASCPPEPRRSSRMESSSRPEHRTQRRARACVATKRRRGRCRRHTRWKRVPGGGDQAVRFLHAVGPYVPGDEASMDFTRISLSLQLIRVPPSEHVRTPALPHSHPHPQLVIISQPRPYARTPSCITPSASAPTTPHTAQHIPRTITLASETSTAQRWHRSRRRSRIGGEPVRVELILILDYFEVQLHHFGKF